MYRLNVGCGSQKFKGYINLDICRDVKPDIVADACHLPFKAESFRVVYTRRCIQVVPDDGEAFAEIHRVLASDGIIVCIVSSFIGWLYYQLRLSPSYGRYKIFHMYTKKRLQRLTKQFAYATIARVRSRSFSYDYQVVAIKKEVKEASSAQQ